MESEKKIFERLSDLPIMPSTIGTMAWNQTGDWRYLTPIIADKLAPCTQSCPAGVPITGYLNAIRNGRLQSALALLLAHNPLPGLTGRLCYHPCQTKCVRRKIDGAISIRQIERFLADLSESVKIEKNIKTNKKVAVIGSGPLGLSCAFYLGCWGCRVVVLDPRDRAGGALVDLSPEKVSPELLETEIGRLAHLAEIRLETGISIDFATLGEGVPEADLVVLDPTGVSAENFGLPAGATAFDPFADSPPNSYVLAAKLPRNLEQFKAPMIAHYIGAGYLTARKVMDRLDLSSGQPGLTAPNPQMHSQPVNTEDINLEYFLSSDRCGPAKSKEGKWEWKQVLEEAKCCLSCGSCNLCLQCVAFCPDASIRLDEDETAIAVDLDHCKGCGICAYECPRGVITMEAVSS